MEENKQALAIDDKAVEADGGFFRYDPQIRCYCPKCGTTTFYKLSEYFPINCPVCNTKRETVTG
jgi:rubrerythrin